MSADIRRNFAIKKIVYKARACVLHYHLFHPLVTGFNAQTNALDPGLSFKSAWNHCKWSKLIFLCFYLIACAYHLHWINYTGSIWIIYSCMQCLSACHGKGNDWRLMPTSGKLTKGTFLVSPGLCPFAEGHGVTDNLIPA